MHRDGASEAVEAAQSQARPSHGRSEQIASNCSKHVVGVGSNGETKGRKASGTDRTFSDFRRAERYQEHIWVRCSGHPTWREGLEQRTERSMARYALVPNRDTPMAAALPVLSGTRCVMSKTVSCSSRSRTLCAGVPVRSNVNALMSCVLSVVVCKSVGNLCVYDC